MDRCTYPSPADAVVIPSEKRPNRLRDHPDPQSAASFLCRAIDSVLSQEGIGEQFDIEVLVIDDGSTDEIPNVVRRYPGLH